DKVHDELLHILYETSSAVRTPQNWAQKKPETLRALLRYGAPEERALAAYYLQQHQSPETKAALIQNLSRASQNYEVSMTVYALTEYFKDQDAYDAILEVAGKSDDPGIRQFALRAFGRVAKNAPSRIPDVKDQLAKLRTRNPDDNQVINYVLPNIPARAAEIDVQFTQGLEQVLAPVRHLISAKWKYISEEQQLLDAFEYGIAGDKARALVGMTRFPGNAKIQGVLQGFAEGALANNQYTKPLLYALAFHTKSRKQDLFEEGSSGRYLVDWANAEDPATRSFAFKTLAIAGGENMALGLDVQDLLLEKQKSETNPDVKKAIGQSLQALKEEAKGKTLQEELKKEVDRHISNLPAAPRSEMRKTDKVTAILTAAVVGIFLGGMAGLGIFSAVRAPLEERIRIAEEQADAAMRQLQELRDASNAGDGDGLIKIKKENESIFIEAWRLRLTSDDWQERQRAAQDIRHYQLSTTYGRQVVIAVLKGQSEKEDQDTEEGQAVVREINRSIIFTSAMITILPEIYSPLFLNFFMERSLKELRDEDWRIRRSAAESFQGYRFPEKETWQILGALRKQLSEENPETQEGQTVIREIRATISGFETFERIRNVRIPKQSKSELREIAASIQDLSAKTPVKFSVTLKLRSLGNAVIRLWAGGSTTIDTAMMPVRDKSFGMNDFLTTLQKINRSITADQGFYLGNQTNELNERDAAVSALVTVLAVDEKQEAVVKSDKIIPIGAGLPATLAKLQEFLGLSDEELPKFLAFDIDDMIALGLALKKDPATAEIEQKIINAIVALRARGVHIAFLSDNQAQTTIDRLTPNIAAAMQTQNPPSDRRDFVFYTSVQVTKFTMDFSSSSPQVNYDLEYSKTARMPAAVVQGITESLGSVYEDASGKIQGQGLLYDYYMSITDEVEGKRVLKTELAGTYSKFKNEVTPHGNLLPLSVEIREPFAGVDGFEPGSASQVSIPRLMSRFLTPDPVPGIDDRETMLMQVASQLIAQFDGEIVETNLESVKYFAKAADGEVIVTMSNDQDGKGSPLLSVWDATTQQAVFYQIPVQIDEPVQEIKMLNSWGDKLAVISASKIVLVSLTPVRYYPGSYSYNYDSRTAEPPADQLQQLVRTYTPGDAASREQEIKALHEWRIIQEEAARQPDRRASWWDTAPEYYRYRRDPRFKTLAASSEMRQGWFKSAVTTVLLFWNVVGLGGLGSLNEPTAVTAQQKTPKKAKAPTPAEKELEARLAKLYQAALEGKTDKEKADRMEEFIQWHYLPSRGYRAIKQGWLTAVKDYFGKGGTSYVDFSNEFNAGKLTQLAGGQSPDLKKVTGLERETAKARDTRVQALERERDAYDKARESGDLEQLAAFLKVFFAARDHKIVGEQTAKDNSWLGGLTQGLMGTSFVQLGIEFNPEGLAQKVKEGRLAKAPSKQSKSEMRSGEPTSPEDAFTQALIAEFNKRFDGVLFPMGELVSKPVLTNRGLRQVYVKTDYKRGNEVFYVHFSNTELAALSSSGESITPELLTEIAEGILIAAYPGDATSAYIKVPIKNVWQRRAGYEIRIVIPDLRLRAVRLEASANPLPKDLRAIAKKIEAIPFWGLGKFAAQSELRSAEPGQSWFKMGYHRWVKPVVTALLLLNVLAGFPPAGPIGVLNAQQKTAKTKQAATDPMFEQVRKRAEELSKKPYVPQQIIPSPDFDPPAVDYATEAGVEGLKIFDVNGNAVVISPRRGGLQHELIVHAEKAGKFVLVPFDPARVKYPARNAQGKVINPRNLPREVRHWTQVSIIAPGPNGYPTVATMFGNGYERKASLGSKTIAGTIYGASGRPFMQMGEEWKAGRADQAFPELREVYIRTPNSGGQIIYQIFESPNAVMVRGERIVAKATTETDVKGEIYVRPGHTITSKDAAGFGYSSMFVDPTAHDSNVMTVTLRNGEKIVHQIKNPPKAGEPVQVQEFGTPQNPATEIGLENTFADPSQAKPNGRRYEDRPSFYLKDIEVKLDGKDVPTGTRLITIFPAEMEDTDDLAVAAIYLKPEAPIEPGKRITFSYKETVQRVGQQQAAAPKGSVEMGPVGVIRPDQNNPTTTEEKLEKPDGFGFHYNSGDFGGAYAALTIEGGAAGKTLFWEWKALQNPNTKQNKSLPAKVMVKIEGPSGVITQGIVNVTGKTGAFNLPRNTPESFRFVLVNEAHMAGAGFNRNPVGLGVANFTAKSEMRGVSRESWFKAGYHRWVKPVVTALLLLNVLAGFPPAGPIGVLNAQQKTAKTQQASDSMFELVRKQAEQAAKKAYVPQVVIPSPDFDAPAFDYEKEAAVVPHKVFDVNGLGVAVYPRRGGLKPKLDVQVENAGRFVPLPFNPALVQYPATNAKGKAINSRNLPKEVQHWTQVSFFAPGPNGYPTYTTMFANGYQRTASLGTKSIPETIYGASERAFMQMGNNLNKADDAFPELRQVFIRRPTAEGQVVYQILESPDAVMVRRLEMSAKAQTVIKVIGEIFVRAGRELTSEKNAGFGFSSMYLQGPDEGFNNRNAAYDSNSVTVKLKNGEVVNHKINNPPKLREPSKLFEFGTPENPAVEVALESKHDNPRQFRPGPRYEDRPSFYLTGINVQMDGQPLPTQTRLLVINPGIEGSDMDNLAVAAISLRPKAPIRPSNRVTFSYEEVVRRADQKEAEAPKSGVEIMGQLGVVREGGIPASLMQEVDLKDGFGFRYKQGGGDFGGAFIALKVEKAAGKKLTWDWKAIGNDPLPGIVMVKIEKPGGLVVEMVMKVDPKKRAELILPRGTPDEFRFVLINEAHRADLGFTRKAASLSAVNFKAEPACGVFPEWNDRDGRSSGFIFCFASH
ncbi:MAG: glucan biosynthesis protein, partial [Candidatus Omnitrophica bacterium]|nr:glucan biosynthesis protein [Candidatus Omnitrophota bacterium]